MRECHNQDFVTFDPVNDPIRVSPQKFASKASAHRSPKFRERGDLFPRPLEFGIEIHSQISGPFLVKGHRFEDFQLGLKKMMDSHE
jgi:hypothetical protein